MKYRARNGWTRETMKARIREGNNGTRAAGGFGCTYLAADGNKCFIGAFLPAGHEGLRLSGGVDVLLYRHPSLGDVLPLSEGGCAELQRVHDGHPAYDGSLSLHERADEWIDANVLNPDEPAPDGEEVE